MFFTPAKSAGKFRAEVELIAPEREPMPAQLMTLQELRDSVGKEFTFDWEIYRNYSLVVFMSCETGKFCYLEMNESQSLDTQLLSYMMYSLCNVGFNSRNYDLIISAAAIAGFNCSQLKDLSDRIIQQNERGEDLAKELGFNLLRKVNTYDLQEVAPLAESLKKYAARMHAKRLQELPYKPEAILTPDEKIKVREYCFVDNMNTNLLRLELLEQIALRVNLGKMYGGVDLRSKSDAQIAETVIGSELKNLKGYYPKKPDFDPDYKFGYKAPDYICFQTPALKAMLEQVKSFRFTLSSNGSPHNPYLSAKEGYDGFIVEVGGKKYAMGLGGLHSMEQRQSIKPGKGWGLFDTDFESFYPKMILNNEWFPAHLGRDFLKVFGKIVADRLDAKAKASLAKAIKNKDEEKVWKVIADSLKITINGTFGKLGNFYSLLYSPDLMVQTTVTGQLTLLMLIEACAMAGIEVVSANTDGFVVHLHESQRATFDGIVKGFEAYSRLKTEETEYAELHSRDVNSYIAIKPDGEVKVKGKYSEKGSTGNSRLSKNPEALIVADAVIAYLSKSTPLVQTIKECRDVKRFLCVKQVAGGGHFKGRYLGKTVRWVYTRGSRDCINAVGSGNMVAGSAGAYPMMDLEDEFPANIDHDRYLADALSALVHIGYTKSVSLFN